MSYSRVCDLCEKPKRDCWNFMKRNIISRWFHCFAGSREDRMDICDECIKELKEKIYDPKPTT